MEHHELKKHLEAHLDTLKKNLEIVPLEVLKTTYQKPFAQLQQSIAATLRSYVNDILFGGFRIQECYMDEAETIIRAAIDQSGLMREISAAAYKRQDMEEIDRLAKGLRKQVLQALAPFYGRHLFLYLTRECFDNPGQFPMYYNEVTGCVWKENAWTPIDLPANPLLLPVREIPDLAA